MIETKESIENKNRLYKVIDHLFHDKSINVDNIDVSRKDSKIKITISLTDLQSLVENEE